MGAQPVPDRLQGLWRRTRLRVPARTGATLDDRSTAVWWLQTPHWHADLRVPAARPDYSGVASLADCSTPQLRWLLTQEGFAGLTHVEGVDGDTVASCRWQRLIDHAESRIADVGALRFDADGMDEWGLAADYDERWVAEDTGPGWSAEGSCDEPPGTRLTRLRIRVGRWQITLRARALDAASTRTVRHAVATDQPIARNALIAAADCEISLAEQVDGPDGDWRVRRSTLPWLEGLPPRDLGPWRALEAADQPVLIDPAGA
ncbi:hypothetical protein [Sphaerotilus mobilis]|uniref:Uncharacterized protein n=1 Tax=Sphaerotilus mobilis TaxID=47994 RepID=A0A4Q7LKF4_9BURK|nr:hypothetical protein [Sphaerotilus mobilis]RZS54914.1 hypothetical protein EV685_2399 [Sphaerotilus mobilis]